MENETIKGADLMAMIKESWDDDSLNLIIPGKITKKEICRELEEFAIRISEWIKKQINRKKDLPGKSDKEYREVLKELSKLKISWEIKKYIAHTCNDQTWDKYLKKGIRKDQEHYFIILDFIDSKGSADIFIEKILNPEKDEMLTYNASDEEYTIGIPVTEESSILIAKELGISQKTVQEYADSVCRIFLANNCSKYRSEVFEKRIDFARSFSDFLASDNNFYLLLGESGVGKTNILCNVVESEKGNHFVFAFDSYGLTKDVLQEIKTFLPTILSETEQGPKRKALFLFDAINEASGYTAVENMAFMELIKDIDTILLKENYPSIKVVVSCRSFSWREIIQWKLSKFSFILKEENQLEIRYFTKEELLQVYPKYRKKYNLLTTVEELATLSYAAVFIYLQYPFQLRWIADVYKNKELPKNDTELDYETLCINKLKQLSNQDARVYKLLYFISRYMIKKRTDRLDEAALFNDNKDEDLKIIRELFQDNNSELSPTAILLMESNFLRKDSSLSYRFEFERIQEAIFAHVFVKDKVKETDYGRKIPVSEYIEIYRGMEHDVVYNNFLRNALILNSKENGYFKDTIKELAVTNDENIQKLAYLTLSKMMHTNYNVVYEIVEQIIEDEKVLGFAWKTTIDLIMDLFIPTVYAQSKDNDKKPVALLQKLMIESHSSITQRLGMNIYIITRRNKDRSKDIMEELFKYAIESDWLSTDYIVQLGLVSFILAIDLVTALDESEDFNNSTELKFIRDNILSKWQRIAERIFNEGVKIIGPDKKLKWLNILPLDLKNWAFKMGLKSNMKKYGYVQKDFVNNLAEYKMFWVEVPQRDAQGWCQKDFTFLTKYLNPYEIIPDDHKCKIVTGYHSNNVFSYVLLERLLIIQGITHWDNTSGLIDEILTMKDCSQYSQMSVAYVLFHIIEKSDGFNQAAFDRLSHLTAEWCPATKGRFYIDTCGKKRYYKQYILNWYIIAYFRWHECQKVDWNNPRSINAHIPVFTQLADKALITQDKDLLFYILDNIVTVATDFGYIEIAIRLFDIFVKRIDTIDKIKNFGINSKVNERYSKDLPIFMSEVISTMGNYFPNEVKGYLEMELYPDMGSPLAQEIKEKVKIHKEELEGLAGLLTHRFGNFFVWGCKNSPEVRHFFIEILQYAEKTKNVNKWTFWVFEKGIRDLIDVKL